MSARNKASKFVHITDFKTKVETNENGGTVRLYNTIVVSFTQDSIMLNTGGFQSAMTKDRMNEAAREFGLGYSVRQHKGVWYVQYNGAETPFTEQTMLLKRV